MNELTDYKYSFIIQTKFILTIIQIIELLCIYFTYDENIFSGLGINISRLSEEYNIARTMYILIIKFSNRYKLF